MSTDKTFIKPIIVAGFPLSPENALKAAIFIREWQQINSEKFNPTGFKVGVIERFLKDPERSKEKTSGDKKSIFEQAVTIFNIKDESDPRFKHFVDVAEIMMISANVELGQVRREDEDLRDTLRVIRKIIFASKESQPSRFQEEQIKILFDAPLYKKYLKMIVQERKTEPRPQYKLSIQEKNIVALYVRVYANSDKRFRQYLLDFFKNPESHYKTVMEVFKEYQKIPEFMETYNALSTFLQSAANYFIQDSKTNAELHFMDVRAEIEAEIDKIHKAEARKEVVRLPEIFPMDQTRFSPSFDRMKPHHSPGQSSVLGRSGTPSNVDSRATTDVDSGDVPAGSNRSSPETTSPATTPGSSPENQQFKKLSPPGKPKS